MSASLNWIAWNFEIGEGTNEVQRLVIARHLGF